MATLATISEGLVESKEIFRVKYDKGYFERLMVQTFTNKPPFYYRLKGVHDRCPIETASGDLIDIIRWYERSIEFNRASINNNPQYPKPVVAAVDWAISKEIEFLNHTMNVHAAITAA